VAILSRIKAHSPGLKVVAEGAENIGRLRELEK
jgi:hypothetical protein